ncbi:glutaredoxin [Alteromonas sp. KUL42]|nr:MAG: hypothetical protein AXW14_00120 [Alteromonas sp. Nap_26]TAP34087.1 glutaredoxin [Alteromonas sp. KUL42]
MAEKTQRNVISEGYEGLSLYYRGSCPFCRYVSAYLKSKSIVIDSKNITDDKSAFNELVNQGGKRQVPCLRITDGSKTRWLYESTDIITFFEKYQAK